MVRLRERKMESVERHEQNGLVEPISLRATRVTPEIIDYVWRQIVEAIHSLRIILFGSQARGEARGDSDLDLLVVHDSPRTNKDVHQQLEYLFWDRRFGLDLVVRKPEEVRWNIDDGNPFYTQHILKQGIVLYDRETAAEAG